ncbi:hypothetical protein O7631_02150 [Micromonospora sp. WMMD967]|uniref:hypothetical protein n=1 Tax=Micromonospora sp. WMMD967 TaxID=3016101 RepID=UPI0024161B5E|nr:hypothetical protein [Micromonospora sp. WMMD967]MDG4835315.1 hypothetical protein [Micromonospora sp. WMMD967]
MELEAADDGRQGRTSGSAAEGTTPKIEYKLAFGPRRRKRVSPALPYLAAIVQIPILAIVLSLGDDGKSPWLDRYARLFNGANSGNGWIVLGWWREALVLAVLFLLLVALQRSLRSRANNVGLSKPPWILIMLIAAAALSVGGLTLLMLFHEASRAKLDAQPQLRIDAIKTAATVVVGTTGVGALLVSLRRHWMGEGDRVSESFNKAIDLLAHEAKIVQVSGLVMLERLMIAHPEYDFSAAEIINYYRLESTGYENWIARRILHRQHHFELERVEDGD